MSHQDQDLGCPDSPSTCREICQEVYLGSKGVCRLKECICTHSVHGNKPLQLVLTERFNSKVDEDSAKPPASTEAGYLDLTPVSEDLSKKISKHWNQNQNPKPKKKPARLE